MTKSEYKPGLLNPYISEGNSYVTTIRIKRKNLPSQNMPLCHKDYLEMVIYFFIIFLECLDWASGEV